MAGDGDHKSFRFLDLPPELRNRIYDAHFNLYVQEGYIHVKKWTPGTEANILAICHQVRNEAAGLYYSTHTFKFYGRNAANGFLGDLTPKNKDQLRSLALEITSWAPLWIIDFCNSLKHLPALREFVICLSNYQYYYGMIYYVTSTGTLTRQARRNNVICGLLRLRGLERFEFKISSIHASESEAPRLDQGKKLEEAIRKAVTQPKPVGYGALRRRWGWLRSSGERSNDEALQQVLLMVQQREAFTHAASAGEEGV